MLTAAVAKAAPEAKPAASLVVPATVVVRLDANGVGLTGPTVLRRVPPKVAVPLVAPATALVRARVDGQPWLTVASARALLGRRLLTVPPTPEGEIFAAAGAREGAIAASQEAKTAALVAVAAATVEVRVPSGRAHRQGAAPAAPWS